MKIIQISHYAGSLQHGMMLRPYYISREFVKMGHEVVIVAASFSHLRQKNPDVCCDIQEEIIKIQLEMLQEFYQRYPKARDMMRITYSKDDSIENTSYETYLRGELSSYGDETLILYAKNIIKLSNENRNLVELTIKQTTRMFKIDLESLKV